MPTNINSKAAGSINLLVQDYTNQMKAITSFGSFSLTNGLVAWYQQGNTVLNIMNQPAINNQEVKTWKNSTSDQTITLSAINSNSRPSYFASDSSFQSVPSIRFLLNNFLSSDNNLKSYYGNFTLALFISFDSTTRSPIPIFKLSGSTDPNYPISSLEVQYGGPNRISIFVAGSEITNFSITANVPLVLTIRQTDSPIGINTLSLFEVMVNRTPVAEVQLAPPRPSQIGQSKAGLAGNIQLGFSGGSNTIFFIREVKMYQGYKSNAELEVIHNDMWIRANLPIPI